MSLYAMRIIRLNLDNLAASVWRGIDPTLPMRFYVARRIIQISSL